jgi:hypothetical protein
MGEEVFKAKKYAEDKYRGAVDMSHDIICNLCDRMHKKNELSLMTFGDYIKDHINRDIEEIVVHAPYEDNKEIDCIRRSEWDTGWISTGEDLPIFDEQVKGDDLSKKDIFENKCKELIESILNVAFDTWSNEFEELEDNGMIYLVYQNTFIGIWARKMYYDTEEFRVQYIHWYSRVEDEEDD